MISDKELLEILQGLYEKTADEGLSWHLKGQPEDNTFFVQLPQSVIQLQYGRHSAEPDFIVFTLLRSIGGSVLASRKVYEGDVGWDSLHDLFSLIKRRDLGWDDVFKNVRQFLGKPTSPVAS